MLLNWPFADDGGADEVAPLGIPHTFETYDGNHISGVQERLEKNVMPFFSKNLSSVPPRH